MKKKIGVVIGRFQTPYLHAGHLYLIGTMLQEVDYGDVFLGCQEEKDERNLYSFSERREMIEKVFGNIPIKRLNDSATNEEWSYKIDSFFDDLKDNEEVILYHSRDSFKDSYKGKFTLKELPEIPGFSATQIRKNLESKV